ncbi:class I tRNA ligase family protein, partial [Patescibacteria group bacterium]|nr:class I tRNA ligase family protein [Patescibacteria group bacterium]
MKKRPKGGRVKEILAVFVILAKAGIQNSGSRIKCGMTRRMKYDHKKIEKKWAKYWQAHPELTAADDKSDKPKQYILDMFPYPSGDGLHAGHVESYTATDIICRYLRMNGKNVLHPQGWDAFGLPAENFAIKTKIHPAETTKKAITTFKAQMNMMGFSYDWSREVNSSSPEYYKWTQWFFLLLYKNGLAYKAKGKVNWCDSCQTVLANEQAEGGVCERCGKSVAQKDLEQWYFKITDFIEPNGKTSGLLDGLDKIDWPESTKAGQRNWIGKSEGAQFKMAVVASEAKQSRGSAANDEIAASPTAPRNDTFLEVFTTRVDTVFGMTFALIAPEHELVQKLKPQISNWSEVEKYISETKKKSELQRMAEVKDKTGVELKGIKVINPFTKKAMPLFASDFVLAHYGTGAVMAVPAHDERD